MDTNVVVSAVLLPRSLPQQAFDRALEHGTHLIASATVTELNDVLRRPRFDTYVHEDERLEVLATLVLDAELVEVTAVVTDCRDPKDNKFLEVARRTEHGWLLAAVGLLGKVLGPIGLARLIWSGEWPWSTAILCLTNDVIWWVPFAFYLYDAWPAFIQHCDP
jgi:putative PIN family toxin of toxin-antitoxin system